MHSLFCKFHYLLLYTATSLWTRASMSPLLRDHNLAIDESLLSDHKLDQARLVCRCVQKRSGATLLAQISLPHHLKGCLGVFSTWVLNGHGFGLEGRLRVVDQVLIHLPAVFHVDCSWVRLHHQDSTILSRLIFQPFTNEVLNRAMLSKLVYHRCLIRIHTLLISNGTTTSTTSCTLKLARYLLPGKHCPSGGHGFGTVHLRISLAVSKHWGSKTSLILQIYIVE